MPIFVQGEMLDIKCLSVNEVIQKYPAFEGHAKQFRSQPARPVPSPGLLYVIQREFATVSTLDDNVTVVGSEDATTCHIICVRNRETGMSSLSHLDGCGMEEAIMKMVDSVSGGHMNEIDLHMFGGFQDDRQLSTKMTAEILSIFHKNPAKVNLLSFCVTDLNDTFKNGLHYPVVYGIALNVKTGEIFHATFPDKGPDCSLRHVRNFTGEHTVLQVYSSLTCELTIGPFNYTSITNAEAFIYAPDNIILQYLSTSPHCEPANFCTETRSTLKYLMENPQPLETVFPNGAPRRYTRNSDNEWQII